MCNIKMLRMVFNTSALCALLALSACFHPPIGIENDATAQQYTADGRPLVNIQIDMGGRGGSKSLSPELAEKYFNYFEVIFARTSAPGNFTGSVVFYRAAGYTNQTIRLAVEAGTYDNTAAEYAIMLAGLRNLTTGECTLLATGVIVDHTGGPAGEPAAKIGPDTTRVTFKLTALTADIKPAVDGAFQTALTAAPAYRFGLTKINSSQYPWFGISTKDQAADTAANLTISGWEDQTGNNTQRFMYLTDTGGEFTLAGINSDAGDQPLSAGSVQGSITNSTGLMNDGDPIAMTFTSTTTVSGMGWFPVRLAVKGFDNDAAGQIWHIGSGIHRNRLTGLPLSVDGGAGAGIVLLHGNKLNEVAVGIRDAEDLSISGYSGLLKITFTDNTWIEADTSSGIALWKNHLGKTVKSIESIGATPALTDGFSQTIIYIGREVTRGESILLAFEAASGELQHRAAAGVPAAIPIGSYAEFKLINNSLGGTYRQEANLDLLGEQNGGAYTGGPKWVAVGNNTSRFTGTFDGVGKDITNLYCEYPTIGFPVGLFGRVDGGAIKNVRIQSGFVGGGSNPNSTDSVGGVAGHVDAGTIENCSNNATVQGLHKVGGLVGDNGGSIIDCRNTGKVVGDHASTGGVVGENSGSITACYNSGRVEVSGNGTGCGGVVGKNNGSIIACGNTGEVVGASNMSNGSIGGVVGENNGPITACYNSTLVHGYVRVGGIVGKNTTTIIGCRNTGPVEGEWMFIGGVVGDNYGSITASYNTGSVTAETGSGSGSGGVVGNNLASGSITACYNTGEALEPDQSYGVGGVAYLDSGTITACYWVQSGDAYEGVTGASIPETILFSYADWPAGNGDPVAAWRIGSADGSGPGHYWKSMGNKKDGPGPDDGPKLWWETP